MAVNNRDEAIIEVINALVPTLTLAQHKALLQDEILNSTVFEKDVIASETPSAGTVTIDYSDKDTATVTTAVDLAVSFSNLENGAVKYLEVTKAATNVISFVGAVDCVIYKDLINLLATSVIYRISNKNGVIYVEALTIPNVNSFANLTIHADYSGYAKYRYNYLTKKVEIELYLQLTGSGNTMITSIPAAILPDRNIYGNLSTLDNSDPKVSFVLSFAASTILTNAASMTTNDHYFAYFEYYKSLP